MATEDYLGGCIVLVSLSLHFPLVWLTSLLLCGLQGLLQSATAYIKAASIVIMRVARVVATLFEFMQGLLHKHLLLCYILLLQSVMWVARVVATLFELIVIFLMSPCIILILLLPTTAIGSLSLLPAVCCPYGYEDCGTFQAL